MVTDTNMHQSDSAMETNTNLVEGNNGTRKVSDNRRSNKPIMEKRRRARINNCLNELKTLILDAMKKDPARHSKLEKADILEMTVKHLRNMHRQQSTISAVNDPTVTNKFRAGYSECTTEVSKYAGLDTSVKRRLVNHLTNCMNQNKEEQQQMQVHILPSPPNEMQNIILGNGGVQLVPTRLPNGDFALILPTPSTSNRSQLPLLVPIPSRTSSTASATSSSSSNYSPAQSPEPMDLYQYSAQKPLSLVMRKSDDDENDEKPWRPW